MDNIKDKLFIFNNNIYVVDEVLLYEYACICRNINTDETEYFRTEYVIEKIYSYNKDLIKLDKNRNSIIIKEEDEKKLLDKIIKYYKSNLKLSDISPDELEVIGRLSKKIIQN